MNETDLNTCIAEAPTDNSEFSITLGASFNLTTTKSIAAGNNITLASTNPNTPATLTRDPSLTGRFFLIDIAAGNTAALTIDSVILDGGNQPAAADNQLIYTVKTGTGDITVNLTGNTILRNNNSTSNGGTILMDFDTHQLNISDNVQIINNTTTANGTLSVLGIFNMSGGKISGNTAVNSGGVTISNSAFNMTGGEISNNIVTGAAGGVSVIGTGPVTISGNAAVKNNRSYGHSGGIALSATGTLILAGGTISGNVSSIGSGGGVFMNSGASFIMTSGSVSSNNAQSGGGVRVSSGGTFIMQGGTISDNTVVTAGGAVLVDGLFSMSGGELSGNTADTGAGVHINAGGTFNMADGKITANTAENNGGGIYAAYENLANLTVGANVVFFGNSAITYARMNPADQALYDAQIFTTNFSLPLPFNGYNNYDISYTSDLPTNICQHNQSLWADDVNCVAAPSTGLFGNQIGGAAISALSFALGTVAITVLIIFKIRIHFRSRK